MHEWAGQLRTVDISKGDSRFANCGLIESYLGQQLAEQAGYFIDYDEASREEMYVAMIASFQGDN